ncbi:hypothetical protein D3C76_751840 [compost metagenome]
MKRIALSGLLITAALLASPVFAADDECDSNLQAVKDDITAAGEIGEPIKSQLEALVVQAEKAHKAGNEKACTDATEKAADLLEKAQEGQ